MLENHLDDNAVVCRLQSLWSDVNRQPVCEATPVMRDVLERLCKDLGATDATWLVFKKLDTPMIKMPVEHQQLLKKLLNGWFPMAAMYLNPEKTLKRVVERWFTYAKKNGLDPVSEVILQNVGHPRVVIRHDVATDAAWENHWFANKFLSYYGIGERMVGMFPVENDCECYVTIDRAIGESPFTVQDKNYFQLAMMGLNGLHRNLCLERGMIASSSPLSKREKQTFSLLLTELSEAEIAEQLGLSAHTIHDYARTLYKKFAVKGRVGLMALALRGK